MDKADYVILSRLQKDSRTPLKELASAADVSIPTARSRMFRLKDLGVIKQLTASWELQVITNQVTGFLTLKTKIPNIKALVNEVKNFDEVSEAYLTTGQHDIILKIHVPNMQAVDVLVTQKLSSIEGIETIHSSFVIETIKEVFGPILRPDFGFKIECDNCSNIIGEGYVTNLVDNKEVFFCSNNCSKEFSRKSKT